MGKKRTYRNLDHIRRRNMPAPSSEAVEGHLHELLSPSVYGQLNAYRQLGLRKRILTLRVNGSSHADVAVTTSAIDA